MKKIYTKNIFLSPGIRKSFHEKAIHITRKIKWKLTRCVRILARFVWRCLPWTHRSTSAVSKCLHNIGDENQLLLILPHVLMSKTIPLTFGRNDIVVYLRVLFVVSQRFGVRPAVIEHDRLHRVHGESSSKIPRGFDLRTGRKKKSN
jgi:hypothetical protein